jgi:hypothetical protein
MAVVGGLLSGSCCVGHATQTGKGNKLRQAKEEEVRAEWKVEKDGGSEPS